MESAQNPPIESYHKDLADLVWQLELGADEAISETPIDRYSLEEVVKTPPKPAIKLDEKPVQSPAQSTTAMAQACDSLDDLNRAIRNFDGCGQKQGAQNTIFAQGDPAARVMIISDAPTKDEDRAGQLFVGHFGELLKKMLGAIGLDQSHNDPKQGYYITSIFPWRAPQNRDPDRADLDLMLPFVRRHIALAQPEIILLMGKSPSKILLNSAESLSKIRGQWQDLDGIPAMPFFHPEFLMRNPLQKRAAWADLLALKKRMEGPSNGKT